MSKNLKKLYKIGGDEMNNHINWNSKYQIVLEAEEHVGGNQETIKAMGWFKERAKEELLKRRSAQIK